LDFVTTPIEKINNQMITSKMKKTPSFPLFSQLTERAQQEPISFPDFDKYWGFICKLTPDQQNTLYHLVEYFYKQKPPPDVVKNMPGGKGVTLNFVKLDPQLQQIILHYVNQV